MGPGKPLSEIRIRGAYPIAVAQVSSQVTWELWRLRARRAQGHFDWQKVSKKSSYSTNGFCYLQYLIGFPEIGFRRFKSWRYRGLAQDSQNYFGAVPLKPVFARFAQKWDFWLGVKLPQIQRHEDIWFLSRYFFRYFITDNLALTNFTPFSRIVKNLPGGSYHWGIYATPELKARRDSDSGALCLL